MWSLDRFPAEWLCTVTVTRGGRDQAGNASSPDVYAVKPVLAGWRSTDSGPWNEAPNDVAVLYLDRSSKAEGQDVQFLFQDKDLIDIPDGPWPSGRWLIDGRAMPGQLGTEVPLRRPV